MASIRILRRCAAIMPNVVGISANERIALGGVAARNLITRPPAPPRQQFVMAATSTDVARGRRPSAMPLLYPLSPMALLQPGSRRTMSTIGKPPNNNSERESIGPNPQSTPTRGAAQLAAISYNGSIPVDTQQRIGDIIVSQNALGQIEHTGQQQQKQQQERRRWRDRFVDDVHTLPHDFHHLSHEVLFHLVSTLPYYKDLAGPRLRETHCACTHSQQAKHNVHGACRERLVREIMRVDNLDWSTAFKKVELMNAKNDENSWLVTGKN